MSNEKRLAEIEARAQAATTGTWGTHYDGAVYHLATSMRITAAGTIDDRAIGSIPDSDDKTQAFHDAMFIGRAPDDVRWLLARVAELEAAQAAFLLPWAHELDAKSLDNFVGDLARAADAPLLFVIGEIHQTVAQWRELVAKGGASNGR